MNVPVLGAAAAAAALCVAPAFADTLRAEAVFNTGIQQKAEQQPADGLAVTYPVIFTGALDGCTGEATETLYGRDEGNWGVYEVANEVTCGDGGFSFISTGSWDDKGFHGAGQVTEGSGHGRYEGLAGRLAQSGGFTPAAGDTLDISYVLLIENGGP